MRLDFTVGDTIGLVSFSMLDQDLPIIHGTHEDELARGVGHHQATALSGEGKQTLLSGHRDSVFRNLGKLELGDIVEVVLPYGEFRYEITDTYIVDADDRTVIDSTIDTEILTISTCYPFSFIGPAPDRYIIEAVPLD
ncbi:class D sortase [Alteribacter keqinensis]|uniref:class D sortase n=1 Tax=Alteribacter keqinensis TaxID=2483800 RepID=UPI002017C28B|nr:class D sortase [Alteribacter keqinensis]